VVAKRSSLADSRRPLSENLQQIAAIVVPAHARRGLFDGADGSRIALL